MNDGLDGEKAHVWLWRAGRYKKAIYDLRYWKGVRGVTESTVKMFEGLAFQPTKAGSLAALVDES